MELKPKVSKSTHIRVTRDLKIELEKKKGNDTYSDFLKKFINLKQEL